MSFSYVQRFEVTDLVEVISGPYGRYTEYSGQFHLVVEIIPMGSWYAYVLDIPKSSTYGHDQQFYNSDLKLVCKSKK